MGQIESLAARGVVLMFTDFDFAVGTSRCSVRGLRVRAREFARLFTVRFDAMESFLC